MMMIETGFSFTLKKSLNKLPKNKSMNELPKEKSLNNIYKLIDMSNKRIN